MERDVIQGLVAKLAAEVERAFSSLNSLKLLLKDIADVTADPPSNHRQESEVQGVLAVGEDITTTSPNTSTGIDETGSSASGNHLREFVSGLSIRKTEVERVVAVAYYLVRIEGREYAAYDRLWQAYKSLSLDYRVVSKAIERACSAKKRWLERRKGQGVLLTKAGLELIENAKVGKRGKERVPSGVYEGNKRIAQRLVLRDNINFNGGLGKASFKEFIKDTTPRDWGERIAMCAWYVSQIAGIGEFDEHDVYTALTKAGWGAPTNLRGMISEQARSYGYYAKAPAKRFSVSENLVDFVTEIGHRNK